jgi:hypothetical protein
MCKDVDGRDTRAFTSVFDGVCPAMTDYRLIRRRQPAHGEFDRAVG